jgi:hypothetical protein
MIKNLLILAILGALIGSSALSGCLQSVTGESILNMTDASGNINITKSLANYNEKGIIFGRITKLTYFWNVIAFEAVKIHVITFNPFNFNTYLSDTTVSILNGYKGSLDTHFICLWGEFSTISPESDIINWVVNKRDPVNNTLQWVVADAPFVHKSGISWALLDANNMNVTGTTVIIHNCDELSIVTGDTYTVQVENHGKYTFCITYDATGLLLFKSEPELY